MKRIFTRILLLGTWALLGNVSAQAQNAAVIHKTDGTVIRVPLAEIDSIVYQGAGELHEAVDMGVSVKWASVNLDIDQPNNEAVSPESFGGLYGWGDPTGTHREQNYGTSRDYYLDDLDEFLNIYGGKGVEEISGSDRDIAREKWGGEWRMATKDEWNELRANCTWTKEFRNGIEGFLVTAKNGNTIFFPYAGWRIADVIKMQNEAAWYWTSTAVPGDATSCYSIGMGTSETFLLYTQRYCGHSIRPVRK